MGFRILFDEVKLKQGFYEQEHDGELEIRGVGWPKGTWFQKRLRQVREQQRKKMADTDFVYECALGTITIRQSNGKDSLNPSDDKSYLLAIEKIAATGESNSRAAKRRVRKG